MSDRFVENAMDELKVGQELKVRVLGIDQDRKRISLTCKADSLTEGVTGTGANAGRGRGGSGNRHRSNEQCPRALSLRIMLLLD